MADQATPHLSFGALLKRQRRLAGMSQKQLAEQAHFSISYISMLERGARAPVAATAELLVAALAASDAERMALLAARERAAEAHVEASLAHEWMAETPAPDAGSQPWSQPVGGFLGATPESALVARTAELATLEAALEATLSGSGRLLMLAGEPGIGKTRLAQELAQRAQARGALVAVGRCYEPRETTALYPVSEMLGALCSMAPEAMRQAMAQRWPAVMPLLPGATIPVASALSHERDAQVRLFWQLADFVRAVSAVRPVAILLDDLHWADATSLDFLAHLARQTRGARVWILGTYRDAEMRRQPALRETLLELVRERLVERVALRQLDRHETAALVAALLGARGPEEVAEELAEVMHRTTEGHALFVREMLRALVERGDVICEDGRWRRRAAGDVELPENVRELIGSRMGQLSVLAREVMQEASVLGQTFTFELARRMGERPASEMEAALEEALAAGVIHEATGRLIGQAYEFDHAVTQRAIYLGILAPRRLRLHRAAGAALESLPERERTRHVAELAWHFRHGGDLERALTYTLLAGEEAERLYAYAEAAVHYDQAAGLARECADAVREPRALINYGRIVPYIGPSYIGPSSNALASLERAVDLYRAGGDLDGRAHATALLAKARGHQEGLNTLLALLPALVGGPGDEHRKELARRRSGGARADRVGGAELARLATRAANRLAPWAAAQVELALAFALLTLSRLRESVAAAERAAIHARAAADLSLLAQALHGRAHSLSLLGHVTDAAATYEEVIHLAEQAGDLRTLHTDLINLGGLLINLGEFARAMPVCARALRVAETLRDPGTMLSARTNLTELAFFMGDWETARAQAERLAAADQKEPRWIDIFFGRNLLALVSGQARDERASAVADLEAHAQSQDIQDAEYACWALAEYALVERRPERAQALLEPLLARYGQNLVTVPRLLALLGWASLELHDEQRASEMIERALAQTARQRTRLFRADALRVRAMIALRAGRLEDAAATLEQALTLCRAMPHPYAEAKTLAVYGHLHQARGERDAARERYTAALAILRRLGERLYAEQMQRALADLDAREPG